MMSPSLEQQRAPLFETLRPSMWQLSLAVLAAAGSGLAMLTAVWGIVVMIGSPTAGLVIASCAAWLLAALLAAASSWLAHEGEARFAARLRRRTARHIAGMPMSSLSRYSGNQLRRLIGDDIGALHHLVAHLPSELATLIVTPIATIILLLLYAGPVALLVLIPGVLATVYFLVVVPRLSARHGEKNARVMGEIITAVDDYAHGMQSCRIYGATSGAAARYERSTRNFTEGFVSYVRKVATLSAIATAFLQAVASYAIAYAIGYGQDPTALAAMLFFGLAIVTPAMRLGHGIDYIREGRVAARQLTALLREPSVPAQEPLEAHPDYSLVAEGLSLSRNDSILLDNLSHSFTRGHVTAITGPSGAGKSSLLRILAGLDSPDGGAVRAARTADAAAHQGVLLIPQGGDVLPRSIRENISLGLGNTEDAALLAALARAQLSMPLDVAAEGLSGGERQRLGIARAFLSDADTILLDEPTSALDDVTADRLMHELYVLARDGARAVVIVTHDPRIADAADAHLLIGERPLNSSGGKQ